MKIRTYILARWFEVRSNRALSKYYRLKAKAEKYFAKIGGQGEQ